MSEAFEPAGADIRATVAAQGEGAEGQDSLVGCSAQASASSGLALRVPSGCLA
jgi:hypothetical protein